VSKSLAFFDASSISRIFSYPKNLITSLRRRKGPEKVGRLSSSNAVYSGILRLSDLRTEAPNWIGKERFLDVPRRSIENIDVVWKLVARAQKKKAKYKKIKRSRQVAPTRAWPFASGSLPEHFRYSFDPHFFWACRIVVPIPSWLGQFHEGSPLPKRCAYRWHYSVPRRLAQKCSLSVN